MHIHHNPLPTDATSMWITIWRPMTHRRLLQAGIAKYVLYVMQYDSSVLKCWRSCHHDPYITLLFCYSEHRCSEWLTFLARLCVDIYHIWGIIFSPVKISCLAWTRPIHFIGDQLMLGWGNNQIDCSLLKNESLFSQANKFTLTKLILRISQ